MPKIIYGVHSVSFNGGKSEVVSLFPATIEPQGCIELLDWHTMSGHTMREMGRRLGISGSHICRVMQGKKTLGKRSIERFKEVRRLEQLINCAPADVALLKYELEEFISAY